MRTFIYLLISFCTRTSYYLCYFYDKYF